MAGPFRFDRQRLAELAASRHAEYVSARPFEHVVLDELLPERLLDEILEEFPPVGAVPWTSYESENERKLASRGDTPIGDATVHLLQSHQIRMLLVDDIGDALQIELFVHADTHVDVVSHDSNRGAAKSRA